MGSKMFSHLYVEEPRPGIDLYREYKCARHYKSSRGCRNRVVENTAKHNSSTRASDRTRNDKTDRETGDVVIWSYKIIVIGGGL